jgi:cytochrome c peroxidase
LSSRPETGTLVRMGSRGAFASRELRGRHPMGAHVVVLALLFAAKGDGALTPVQQLGKALFFDKISSPAAVACGDCHGEAFGWAGPTPGVNQRDGIYQGAVRQRFGNRKPPSSAYAVFSPTLRLDEATGAFVGGSFWDGRATGEHLGSPAADQALGPILNPLEQNMPDKAAVCEHVAESRYADLFRRVWGPAALDCGPAGVDAMYDRIGLSIAEYEGSAEMSPFSSRFDAYLAACLEAGGAADACGLGRGAKAALDPRGVLTAQEFDGLSEFGDYCSGCHASVPRVAPDGGRLPPLFTTFRFENIGVPRNPENPFYRMDAVLLDDGTPVNPLGAAWVDLGLGAFLRTRPEWSALAAANEGRQRIPTLRNVDKRAGRSAKAFMHNGALRSLEQVVHFYNTRDVAAAGWPPPEVAQNVNRELVPAGDPLGNLGLAPAKEAAIVAFLRTLSDEPRDAARAP